MSAWGAYVRAGRSHFDRVVRSYSIFARNARELVMLLHSVETDPVRSLTLMQDSDDGPIPDSSGFRTEFWAQLDQRLHNMVSGAISVVDQTRPLVKFYGHETAFVSDFTTRSKKVAESPRAVFLRRLRNYLLHYGVAPMMQTMNLAPTSGEDWDHLKVQLSGEALLAWDGWTTPSRAFIQDQDGGPHLRQVTVDYFEDMRSLYEWVFRQYSVLHVPGVPPAHLRR